ncbi:MmgE/PrpD family protein [Caenimonas aquaedulcis]|uniref:MmgE/PrpD family protein n=1 Tax=Caenimonas aquaedulcis TaxID=2793270 RepID=A0A931H2N7_9BURK|nr:MmgE/PrpD family protein [Caenimonas aquaedulcis]MBG9387398.1 MmgE/PrpD family protein [Caenimonas aquaedulcis]
MALTKELAGFVGSLRFGDVPPAALPFIRSAFTDCFATLVAGRVSEPARILRETLDPPPGESRLFVDQGTARAPEAAWLNATAAHALDFDDAAQKGHLSAVLVPAILAEADACDADGRAMATAYAAGYETWAELLRREPGLYHNHSWHPTGVFGPLAAAAACASLRGLDARHTAHALGMAASRSGGVIANFGSMTKPLHAGIAAHAGVMAARLAQRGFTASPDALEGSKGLMRGISPEGRVDVDSPVLAGRDWKLPRDGVNIKKYPVCFATHRALDGILDILAEQVVPAGDVKRIAVTISRRNKSTLRFDAPQDRLQAKFSMQFAMASAIVAHRCGLQELDDALVQRADVRELMRAVEVIPTDEEAGDRAGEAPVDVVQLQLQDGRTLRREVDYVRGGPERPLLPGELFAKFESCLQAGGLAADARPLFNALMAVDELPGTRALYALAESREIHP